MSTVSVIIPCYKYAHFLRDCVESALRQDGVDVRVLIMDDCSPDHTPDVARQLVAEDARVEYHRNATNRGHIETYNIGLDWVAGDYCLLLSADDMLTPGALARAARVMDERPDVVLTCGREARVASPRFDALPNPAEYAWRVLSGPEFWEMSGDGARNLVPTPTAIARASAHKAVGGYRKELPHAGDLEMWLRFAAHGSVAMIDAPQGVYRLHGQNMSDGFVGLGDLRQKHAAFASAAREYADRVPGAARVLARADRSLAEQAVWTAARLFDAGDLGLSLECLEFAQTLCPDIRNWGPWRRLRVKRLIGPTVWGGLRPVLHWARRTGRRPVATH